MIDLGLRKETGYPISPESFVENFAKMKFVIACTAGAAAALLRRTQNKQPRKCTEAIADQQARNSKHAGHTMDAWGAFWYPQLGMAKAKPMVCRLQSTPCAMHVQVLF